MSQIESINQKRIIEYLYKKGWFVRKILQTNKPGDADILAIKIPRVVWIEVKRKGKYARPLQEFRGKEVIKNGMEWYQADTFEKFLTLPI